MKIGFSFGRCVASIVRGEVDINDVLCIIARTHMPDQEDVEWVINEYTNRHGYLAGLDKESCLKIGVDLWKTGRVIEPRSNGIHAMQVPNEFVWMDLYPTEANLKNEGVKKAWNAYRTLITLSEQLPEADSNAVKHGERLPEAKEIDPMIMQALIV